MFNKTDALIAVLTTIISIPFSVIWGGYVLSYLWLWFLVPLGLPIIGLAHAIGIMGIKGFLTARLMNEVVRKAETGKEIETLWKGIVFQFSAPAVSLLFGYIVVTWFM